MFVIIKTFRCYRNCSSYRSSCGLQSSYYERPWIERQYFLNWPARPGIETFTGIMLVSSRRPWLVEHSSEDTYVLQEQTTLLENIYLDNHHSLVLGGFMLSRRQWYPILDMDLTWDPCWRFSVSVTGLIILPVSLAKYVLCRRFDSLHAGYRPNELQGSFHLR
jgi:hypothetical protein